MMLRPDEMEKLERLQNKLEEAMMIKWDLLIEILEREIEILEFKGMIRDEKQRAVVELRQLRQMMNRDVTYEMMEVAEMLEEEIEHIDFVLETIGNMKMDDQDSVMEMYYEAQRGSVNWVREWFGEEIGMI